MELAAAVLTYYFTHAEKLSSEKRFHLASRMAAWNGDGRASALLEQSRAAYVPEPVTPESLAQSLEEAAQHAERGQHHIVSYELRKPFFDQYPTLIGLEAELFRVRHLDTLFHVDARGALFSRHPEPELRQLAQSLLADKPALRSLSTWPINYLYLLHRVILRDSGGIDVRGLYELGDGYDTADPEQLRLFIYLYTHCIIAESNFYARGLPRENLPVYRDMLHRLEGLLSSRLEQTSLDTKLEFLVCCRLAGYETGLQQVIHEECAQSVSPDGTFLVDTHNVFKDNTSKKSFEASEHRNVLFVMSALPRA